MAGSSLIFLVRWLRASLSVAAARVSQAWACLLAGAVSRGLAARDTVITVGRTRLAMLRPSSSSSTVAGTLLWVVLCLFVSLLGLPLGWVVARVTSRCASLTAWLEDFVDSVLVDEAKRAERRRVLAAWERQWNGQVGRLAQLNQEAGRLARLAEVTWRDAVQRYFSRVPLMLGGPAPVEHLRPAAYDAALPVAITVPDTRAFSSSVVVSGSVRRLGGSWWSRLLRLQDEGVLLVDAAVARVRAAVAANQAGIDRLERMIASRLQEIAAIDREVNDRWVDSWLSRLSSSSSPRRAIAGAGNGFQWATMEATTTMLMGSPIRLVPRPDGEASATSSSSTTPTTTRTTTSPTANDAAAVVPPTSLASSLALSVAADPPATINNDLALSTTSSTSPSFSPLPSLPAPVLPLSPLPGSSSPLLIPLSSDVFVPSLRPTQWQSSTNLTVQQEDPSAVSSSAVVV